MIWNALECTTFPLTALLHISSSGTPINKPPVLGYKDLNLFKLFRLVYHQGGCDKVSASSLQLALSPSLFTAAAGRLSGLVV